MQTIQLQTSTVYGPIHSRRFGMSLGINLLPATRKICSFDCIYCQYSSRPGPQVGFPAFCQIVASADEAFRKLSKDGVKIDWIMLSGNGEPTLHPDFPEIVELLLSLRNNYFSSVPIGVLSNSSTCYKSAISLALSQLDGRFMKLDAGSADMFHAIDQPSSTLMLESIVRGLRRLQHVTLQSMFISGRVDNTGDKAIDHWIETVKRIHPDEVQIYTVDRTPVYSSVLPVEKAKLQWISDRLKSKTQIISTVY